MPPHSPTFDEFAALAEELPEFVLPDERSSLVSLSALRERGPVVVAFHRGHWCPYCRINAVALTGIEPLVRAAGGQIVAITPELQSFAAEFKAEAGATFPVLTDMDNGYALQLNLAFRIGDEQRLAMSRLGRDLVRFQGNANWTLPIPATFVVGRDGRIKARFVDPDYRNRMAVEHIVAALKT